MLPGSGISHGRRNSNAGQLLRFDTPRGNLGKRYPKAVERPLRHASIPAFLHLVLDVEQHIRQPSALGQTV